MNTRRVSLPDTEVHALRSDAVGDDFELWVARPQAGFVPAASAPHVLYVLDANLFFGTAVEMTRIMHKLYGELPPFLVVGIAYPTDDGFMQSALRTRDFTPSEDAGFAAMAGSMPGPPLPSVTPPVGGADAFLRFLDEEVIPFVRSTYDVTPAGSTIFGSSFGGLLAAYALLTTPDLVDNYILVSPGLWWDDSLLLGIEPRLREDGAFPGVFLAAGSLEEAPEVPMLAQFKLIGNTRELGERLTRSGYPSTTTTVSVLEGETHTSVVPVALTRGLRQLFPRRRPSSD